MKRPKALGGIFCMMGCLLVCTLFCPRTDADVSLSSPSVHELTAADLETFLDIYMPLQLARENVAGAAIAVVKDGKVLLAKGYGYADVARKTPVSAEATLFRLGSISKLFTWTAVMQQVEEGKLDLDRDISDYLDFKIPATFEKPITLRHLMTHTAGFEEAAKDMEQPDAASIKPLGGYLSTHIPGRIFPAGTVPAYSNYGAALAGYIVERVSGKLFPDYAAERLFRPMGMDRTTFMQSPPAPLAAMLSQGYQLGSGDAKPFEFYQIYPAGAASATALDMTRFALTLLNHGAGERGRILSPKTVQLMLTRQFSYRNDMNGMGLGFFDQTRNGRRIIGHSGDSSYFHSDLHLVPEEHLAFFISYNSAGRGEIGTAEQTWHAFLDRYMPYTLPPEPTLATAKDDARAVVGSYLSSRRAETTMLDVTNFFGSADVVADADGTIGFPGWRRLNGQPSRFREIAPLVYRDVDGQGRLVFQPDSTGRMTIVTDSPLSVYQRVSYLRTGHFVVPVLEASLWIIALTLVLWPVAALIRRHYGAKLTLSRFDRRLRLAAFGVCALYLACILLPAILVRAIVGSGPATAKLDPALWLFKSLGLLAVAGTPIVIFAAFRAWRRQSAWCAKLQATGIAIACIAFAWFLFAANLLKFNVMY